MNEYFKKPLDTSVENFANFLHINNEHIDADKIDQKEIDYLARRIAQNMLYFEENINTAKSDFISFLGILLKKGIILKDLKDQPIDPEYNY